MRSTGIFFISQTAVTQQIRKLEEIVNVQLFTRTKQYVFGVDLNLECQTVTNLYQGLLGRKGAPHDGTQFMQKDYFQAGFVPKVVMQTNDTQTILMLVYIGMGITIVPEFWANLAKQILNLAFVPLEGDNEKITLVAAWNKQNENPALANVIRTLNK